MGVFKRVKFMSKIAYYETKIGYLKIEYEGNRAVSLKKVGHIPDDFGQRSEFSDKVYKEMSEYYDGKRKKFTFDIEPRGTEFQKKVWAALCEIPYGETRTYKEIATAVGNEKACRAVGMANNKNPLHVVVPCHRVIGADGKLVGYASGLELKEFLLKTEKENK